MNTVKSFWYGWGALIVAGGGAYYFAKRSINEDRQARFDKEQQRRRVMSSLEHSGAGGAPQRSVAAQARPDAAGSPGADIGSAPMQANNTPKSEHEKVSSRSKYEASEPFRSKKGDRFS